MEYLRGNGGYPACEAYNYSDPWDSLLQCYRLLAADLSSFVMASRCPVSHHLSIQLFVEYHTHPTLLFSSVWKIARPFKFLFLTRVLKIIPKTIGITLFVVELWSHKLVCLGLPAWDSYK